MNIYHQHQIDLFQEKEFPGIVYHDSLILDHQTWFEYFKKNLSWNNRFMSRKTAMFGVSYGYDGKHYRAPALPDFLNSFCQKIELEFGYYPNSCLINNYPNGDHYISYHSDLDMEMNDHTGVTIISLGAVREMGFRLIEGPTTKHFVALQPGSALYMDDKVQAEWQHGITKQAGAGHRISLSFRSMITK